MDITRRNILKTLGAGAALSFASLPFYSFAEEKNDKYILIKGGSFNMGSPESEFLREKDEMQHKFTISPFYMSKYQVTQQEYSELMGNNPSEFKNDNAPVENVTWYDAVNYCNKLSKKEGLAPAYIIDGVNITWNKSADGYRLPTEAEWEYAARAGTTTPFYTGENIGASQANWYATYPYKEESRYGGTPKEKTNEVGLYKPNPWGLYDMSGNAWDWCWDWYGNYNVKDSLNPSGPEKGVYKVHRGGGWNDFGRHLRCAYRAAFTPSNRLYNIGFRTVRNAEKEERNVLSSPIQIKQSSGKKILIYYYTWSGNTGKLAREIHKITGGDILEMKLLKPYSSSYGTCLTQSRRDQQKNERPEIQPIDIRNYDIIFLGYPTWWATMPMHLWNFLERNARILSDKVIIPFASHGEGRLAQTISAISKSVPQTTVKEAFSVMYSRIPEKELKAWIKRVTE